MKKFLLFIVDAVNLPDNDLKQILTGSGLNSFSVRFRLLHIVKTINGGKIIDHSSIPIWESDPFSESILQILLV
jgi:hypothetical protein